MPAIRACAAQDYDAIHAIINDAAQAYRDVIPADCWHEPYMSTAQLRAELAAGVTFFGYERDGELLGVMGIQDVKDVSLIRHAYVRSDAQRQGIGAALLDHLRAQTQGRLLVGTWAAAMWAIRFYEQHAFRLTTRAEGDALLQKYWSISVRQRETSVVLIQSRHTYGS